MAIQYGYRVIELQALRSASSESPMVVGRHWRAGQQAWHLPTLEHVVFELPIACAKEPFSHVSSSGCLDLFLSTVAIMESILEYLLLIFEIILIHFVHCPYSARHLNLSHAQAARPVRQLPFLRHFRQRVNDLGECVSRTIDRFEFEQGPRELCVIRPSCRP